MIANASNIEVAFILAFAVLSPALGLLCLAVHLRRRHVRRRNRHSAAPARSFLEVIGRNAGDRR